MAAANILNLVRGLVCSFYNCLSFFVCCQALWLSCSSLGVVDYPFGWRAWLAELFFCWTKLLSIHLTAFATS